MEFTPTEQRILTLLSDGDRHLRIEVHGCLWDDLAKLETIRFHICNIRAKLLTIGETIIAETDGKRTFYRHVRLLVPTLGVE